MEAANFWPEIDVEESEKEYYVSVDIPGVDKQDVHVRVDDGALVIEGERREERAAESASYMRRERAYGRFVRRMGLPTTIDTESIKARLDNGTLHVTVPKSKAAREAAREISIS
jgi:HSP20 family protein